MLKCLRKSGAGFTIIEVSLVLAMGGLILLMVFLALPNVWRIQKDSQRQEDMSTIIDGVKRYQSNNRGALPSSKTAWLQFYKDYLGSGLADPDGTIDEDNEYGYFEVLSVASCTTSNNRTGEACTNSDIVTMQNNSTNSSDPFKANGHMMAVTTQATCGNGEDANAVVKSANTRKVALLYTLENGSLICKNS